MLFASKREEQKKKEEESEENLSRSEERNDNNTSRGTQTASVHTYIHRCRREREMYCNSGFDFCLCTDIK